MTQPALLHTVDIGALVLALLTFEHWLPEATLAATFLWTLIRLYREVDELLHRRKDDGKSD